MRRSPVFMAENTQSFDINHAGFDWFSRGIICMMDSEYLWDRGTGPWLRFSVNGETRETGEEKDEGMYEGGRSKKTGGRYFDHDKLCGNTPAVFDRLYCENPGRVRRYICGRVLQSCDDGVGRPDGRIDEPLPETGSSGGDGIHGWREGGGHRGKETPGGGGKRTVPDLYL